MNNYVICLVFPHPQYIFPKINANQLVYHELSWQTAVHTHNSFFNFFLANLNAYSLFPIPEHHSIPVIIIKIIEFQTDATIAVLRLYPSSTAWKCEQSCSALIEPKHYFETDFFFSSPFPKRWNLMWCPQSKAIAKNIKIGNTPIALASLLGSWNLE